jgi:hypothetical protein
MPKLTDTQLIILSAASRRDDREAELPANIKPSVNHTSVGVPGASVDRISASRTVSLFERRDGLGVLLVGPRAGAHMRETQVLQCAIDSVVRPESANSSAATINS